MRGDPRRPLYCVTFVWTITYGMAKAAGYSSTPLARKLGIEPGDRLALLNAPDDFEDALEGLPGDVVPQRDPRGQTRGKPRFDVVVLFVPDASTLSRELGRGLDRIEPDGALWVSWPKKSSARFRDLTEDGIRAAGLAAGVVDNKVCAVDADWSGLRLVVRVADRPSR